MMEEPGTSPIEPSLPRIARTLADLAMATHGPPSAVRGSGGPTRRVRPPRRSPPGCLESETRRTHRRTRAMP